MHQYVSLLRMMFSNRKSGKAFHTFLTPAYYSDVAHLLQHVIILNQQARIVLDNLAWINEAFNESYRVYGGPFKAWHITTMLENNNIECIRRNIYNE